MQGKPNRFMIRTAPALAALIAAANIVIAQAPPSAFLPALNRHPRDIGGSQQAIIVTTGAPGHHALLYSYQMVKGSWQVQFIPMWASIGKHGFSDAGDGEAAPMGTPRGIYSVVRAFGTDENPETSLEYQREPLPVYCDRPSTAGEADLSPLARRDYFSGRIQILLASKDRGDRRLAIHLWRHQKMYTAGSIGISELTMQKLLRWLDREKTPVIIAGPADFVRSLK
jgi:L,D-peptidoglycan transpeptidase YkuD (ErfK/YbiS/YcfS/YnhG family)